MTTLPAHLQGRQQTLVGRAADGMGGMLPPHISIKDNRFTFVDAAGNRRMHEMVNLDIVVADISDVTAKMFFEYGYEPGDAEPPSCWSSNGIGPSVDALRPQALTCEACPNNVRGSATSTISNKPIKACRDEKYLVVVAAPHPDMRWRLVLTPGSFKNWSAYTRVLADRGVDLPWVITRLGFERQGVLSFSLLENGWTPAGILETIDRERASHQYDLLAGRLDKPRLAAKPPEGALAAPAASGAVASVTLTNPGSDYQAGAVQPAQPQSFQPNPAPTPHAHTAAAASGGPQGFGAQTAPTAAGPAQGASAEPARRKRRTRAEMEAARAGQAPPAGAAQQPQGEIKAPFPTESTPPANAGSQFGAGVVPPAAAFGQPNGGTPAAGSFGIQAGQQPGDELRQMLDNTFGPAKA